MNNNYLIYGLDEYLINKEIDKIIKKNNIDKNSIIKYSLNEDSIDNILEDEDTILVKGSHSMNLIEVVDYLRKDDDGENL